MFASVAVRTRTLSSWHPGDSVILRLSDLGNRGISILDGGVPVTHSIHAPEQICCDLHIGDAVRAPGDENRHAGRDRITLRPSDCLRLETRETIVIPDDVFGLVCSRASLSAEGL